MIQFEGDPSFFLNNIMKNLPELVYFKDIRSRFIMVNDAFCKAVNMDNDALRGKTDFHLYHPDHAMAAYECEQKIIATGNPVVGLLEKQKWPDGRVVWVSTTKVPLYDEGGEIIGTFGMSRDVTERKLLEEELLSAHKLESIGHLAAGIAHEINTPIQFVGDNLRFLKDAVFDLMRVFQNVDALLGCVERGEDVGDAAAALQAALGHADLDYLKEELPDAITQSLEGTGRVAQIVRAMKNFSHPDTKEMEKADLNEAIRTTVQVARNEWKYSADMVLNLDEHLPPVPCHLGEFNQVILNMIVNARDAIVDVSSEAKGVITIETAQVGAYVSVRISDTGCGMSEAVKKSIFNPFFTTKEVGKGSGQGLAISHNVIVQHHRGKISVNSEPGKGTTFVLLLPLVQVESSDAAD